MERNEKMNKWFEHVQAVLNNEDFKALCERRKNENPHFEEELKIAEKIAKLNTDGISVNEDLIHMSTPFSSEEISKGGIAFYAHIDKLCPPNPDADERLLKSSLVDVVRQNQQYLKPAINGKSTFGERSFCSSRVLDDGTEERLIYCNFEGRIGDIVNIIHEFAHSMSETFLLIKKRFDIRVSELPTVISNYLSNFFLQGIFPTLKQNFNEDMIRSELQNIAKAREVLIEGLIMKVAIGELTLEDVATKHPDLFFGKTMEKIVNSINATIERLEDEKNSTKEKVEQKKNQSEFAAMYEFRYLIPNAAANIMLERYKENPKKVAEQFKLLIAHDHHWSLEKALDILGLGTVDEVVDDYIKNFPSRMNSLIENRDECEIE